MNLSMNIPFVRALQVETLLPKFGESKAGRDQRTSI